MPTLPPELGLLAQEMDREAPRVLVLVGAGVTKGATGAAHASWQGLLSHGIEFLYDSNHIKAARKEKLEAYLQRAFSTAQFDDVETVLKYAEYVELALKMLDEGEFADWLSRAFGNLRAIEGRQGTLEGLRELEAAGALLMTTNYDSLLTDATGLPPLTWKEHEKCLQVSNREIRGIIHLHGHWRSPTSIVLGQSSYYKIAASEKIQTLLKNLWLSRFWVFVGCGGGLQDPNLGPLFEWAEGWGTAVLPDYLICKKEVGAADSSRALDLPKLIKCNYDDHSELPAILHSITPEARCWPFVRIDEKFSVQTRRPSDPPTSPFPSWEEYINGDVPGLKADQAVRERLADNGWACVLDASSVGKTTLALRLATSGEQLAHPAFYLDLKSPILEENSGEALEAMQRLSRPGYFLIIDNIHHQPELVWSLFEWYRNRQPKCKLLLIGTRIQSSLPSSALEDLSFLAVKEQPIELRPEPEDLRRILKYILGRLIRQGGQALPDPPEPALLQWHRDFRNALGAFCIAVMELRGELSRASWQIPHEAASNWVRKRWLLGLDHQSLENLNCLAVFGSQELELSVQRAALPHPDHVDELMERGLVAQVDLGASSQFRHFHLREPGWGKLILAAQPEKYDQEEVLHSIALKSPALATQLSSRFRRTGMIKANEDLWRHIAAHKDSFLPLATKLPLGSAAWFLRSASLGNQDELIREYCDKTLADPESFSRKAMEESLQAVAAFFDLGPKEQLQPLWQALEGLGEQLTNQMVRNSWMSVSGFLGTAYRHGRDVASLWLAFLDGMEDIAEQARRNAGGLRIFLETVCKLGLDTRPIWDALDDEELTTIKDLIRTMALQHVPSFLDIARQNGVDSSRLWTALAADLEERVRSMPLQHVPAFFDAAKQNGIDSSRLWTALAADPEELAERVRNMPIEHAAHFLDAALSNGVDTSRVWEALVAEPNDLANSLLAISLEHVGAFFKVMEKQDQATETLWQAIEENTEVLQERAKSTPFPSLAGFFKLAPLSVIEAALDGLQTDHWSALAEEHQMDGATRVAGKCREAGREDHMAAIMQVLLGRAQCPGIPARFDGFASAIWLISNTPDSLRHLLPRFLDMICTEPWLGWQYKDADCISLAAGLRMLAFTQPPEIIDRFADAGLRLRIAREFASFAKMKAMRRSHAIQLVGSASLVGVRADPAWLARIQPSTLASLPETALPHNATAENVSWSRYQLWLGLRAASSALRTRLPISSNLISQALNLWRQNLSDSASEPESKEHEINGGMVAWLEDCLRAAESPASEF